MAGIPFGPPNGADCRGGILIGVSCKSFRYPLAQVANLAVFTGEGDKDTET